MNTAGIALRVAESDADYEAWRRVRIEVLRAVNEKLGYVTRTVSIRVRGSLPLPR